MVRSLLSAGMVNFAAAGPKAAEITVIRIDPEGEAASFETHAVPFDEGRVSKAVDDFREGLPIIGYPSMSYDYAFGRVEVAPDYHELRGYVSFALPFDHCTINERGRKDNEIVVGVGAFRERDGLTDDPVPVPRFRA